MALGRISGPLLKANLVRDGVNLAFETDLLYLDVVNSRVGVNNSSPQYDLDVNGTTKTTTLTASNSLTAGNISFSGNTISSTNSIINFSPAAGNPTIYQATLQVGSLQLNNNTISTSVTDTSIQISPNGSGQLSVTGNTSITGNLSVGGNISTTGNVTIGGNIILGTNPVDTIVLNASIASNIIPLTDNTYDLGTSSLRWRSVYANNLYSTNLRLNSLNIGNINFSGNTISTSTNTDLTLVGNGTGGITLGNFRIKGSTITNVVPGAVTSFVQSGTGYFDFSNAAGFVPPVGNSNNRPNYTPPLGMARYNTDSQALEVWNGTQWASPAGAAAGITDAQAITIAVEYAITLG